MLEKSALATWQMFAGGLDKGKLNGQKTPLMTTFSYIITHERYHVGEIGMTLNESGHKLGDQTAYAIWSWGRWVPGGKAHDAED